MGKGRPRDHSEILMTAVPMGLVIGGVARATVTVAARVAAVASVSAVRRSLAVLTLEIGSPRKGQLAGETVTAVEALETVTVIVEEAVVAVAVASATEIGMVETDRRGGSEIEMTAPLVQTITGALAWVVVVVATAMTATAATAGTTTETEAEASAAVVHAAALTETETDELAMMTAQTGVTVLREIIVIVIAMRLQGSGRSLC